MHPYLFQIGHFRVPAYGVFSLLALGVGVLLFRRFARIDGLDPGKAVDAVVVTIAVGYFGARALEIVVEWRRYFATPGGLRLLLYSTGFFLGGVIVAVPFGYYWFRRVGIPYGKGLDLLAVAGAVAEAIGRWGCFCSGCCWGTPTHVPWAVTFPEIARRLHPGLPDVPIHPTQLYQSLAGWTILGVLAYLYPRKRFDGQILATFILLYGATRFVLEFFRGDEGRGRVGALSTSQALAVPLVVLAGWAYARGLRRAEA